MLEVGVVSCLCLDVGCWVVSFPGPRMWVFAFGVLVFCFWVACARVVGCLVFVCVVLYRVVAHFPSFLGEVLSVFYLFWWPLVSSLRN